jgi:serine protease
MFATRNRRDRRSRRPERLPLQLEALEERTLLNAASPTTILDLNGLGVDPNHYSATDILVRFQTPPGSAGGLALVKGTTLAGSLPLVSGLYEVNLPRGMSVAAALAAYKAEKGVLDAEPDYHLTVSSVPNDPLLSQQWGLNNTGQGGGKPGADIHAEQAWSVTTGSPSVTVAVMDTGIDYNQPDLVDNVWINQAEIPNYWYTKSSPWSGYDKIVYKSQIKTATPGIITFRDLNNPVNAGLVWHSDGKSYVDPSDLLRSRTQGGWEYTGNVQDGDTAHPNDFFGWNFVDNTNNPMDNNGHGTNVAGILGATGNNGTGVAGVDWNVQIMPVKFMGADGSGTVSDFIQGLNYAIRHGAKITNNSWDGAPYSSALYGAVLNAADHGQIFVAAAGNQGTNNDNIPDYPASLSLSLSNVVAVAATDNQDNLASFSNYGPNSVALAAPGVNILSTLPDGEYGTMSGTSMAAPEVTGAMALVWGLHPNWSYHQVIDQVLNTVDKLPSLEGKVSSGGRLDVAAAVGWNLSTQTTPTVTNAALEGVTTNSMDAIRLTFNEPIDVSTFASSDVTLTDPYGRVIPVSVSVVPNSGDRQIQLSFANHTVLGNYHLSINSYVRDMMGVRLAPYSATIELQAARTYSNNTWSAIGARGLAMSTITVPAGTAIGDIQVKMNVRFPDDGQLYAYLISPTGKTIALVAAQGGTGANFTNTVFSQSGSSLSIARAPFSGTYAPEGSFAPLLGTNPGGAWRLAIRNYGWHTGELLNWSLTITPAARITSGGAVSTSHVSSSTKGTSTKGTSAAQTYSNTKSFAIGARGLALSPITIPPGATIGNLQVKMNVRFPDDGQLYAYLISPTGKTIALVAAQGGTGANFTNTVFSQSGSSLSGARAPFWGTYMPEASLSQLFGGSAGGTWRLAVRNYGYHTGELLNWSLTITPAGRTSSVQVSSLGGEPASSFSSSSPSTPNSATPQLASIAGVGNVSTLGGATNDSTLPPSATSGNDVPSSSPGLLRKVSSSVRSLVRPLSGWLDGKRSSNNSLEDV